MNQVKPNKWYWKGTALALSFTLLMTGCIQKPKDVLLPSEPISIQQGGDSKPLLLVTENYVPFQYEEEGRLKGIAVDLVTEMYRRLDYPVQVEIRPWTRALRMMQDGEADGIFSAYYSEERGHYMRYMTLPLAYDEQYVYSLKQAVIPFDGTLEGLKPYRIGVLKDWYYGDAFETAVKRGELAVETVTDMQINIQKLIDGKIDVIINPQINMKYYLREMGYLDHITEHSIPFREPAGLYLAISSKMTNSETHLKALDAVLSEMQSDGTYQMILNAYTE